MMINDLLLSNKKHTDMLIEQTKTRSQQTPELKLVEQRETFWFNPPINLVEEGKWLLRLTSFETTNSVFNIPNENTSFSADKTNYDLNKVIELRSENDNELHVEQC